MASKSSRSSIDTTADPRIARKEVIITRHKSAQLKRQLRGGDRSMKRLTKLLKSPERQSTLIKSNAHSPKTYKNTTLKQKSSPKSLSPLAACRKSSVKSPRKRKVTEKTNNTDYYPDKAKRMVIPKRVTLKSKHKLTMVHRLNKRKRTTPRKGATTPPPPLQNPQTVPTLEPVLEPTPSPEPAPLDNQHLTVGELVNAFDEDSLTNEDLMEILTCPSPVWWEDPPDESFTDEPLPSTLLGMRAPRKRPKKTTRLPYIIKVTSLATQGGSNKEESEISDEKHDQFEETPDSVDLQVELTKKDDQFIQKRSVLENILSGIKTKTLSYKTATKKTNSNTSVTQTVTKFDEVLRENSEALQKSLLRHKPSILKSEARFGEEIIDATSDTNTQGSSEDLFGDTREEDILNDLENLVIPIETTKVGKEKQTLDEAGECIVLDEDVNWEKAQISPVEESMKAILVEGAGEVTLLKNQVFQPPESLKTTVWSRKGEKNSAKAKDGAGNVPADMPPLQKYAKVTENKMASPCSSKFESSESDVDNASVLSSQDGDTISDTNVRYLNDDQISDYEGDRVKSKKDFDSGISLGDSNKSKIEDVKENPEKFEEKQQFFLKESKPGIKNEITNKCTASNTEIEGKKDCIVVYKIIETVPESNVNQTVTENNNKIKPKRALTKKQCTNKNSPNTNKRSPNIGDKRKNPSLNNLEEVFLNYKKASQKNNRISKSKFFLDDIISSLKRSRENIKKTDVKKPIAVTDRKTVNYCLKCSAIFDTNTCNYCVNKT